MFKEIIPEIDIETFAVQNGEITNNCVIFKSKNSSRTSSLIIYVHGGPEISIININNLDDILIKSLENIRGNVAKDKGNAIITYAGTSCDNDPIGDFLQQDRTLSVLPMFKALIDQGAIVAAVNYRQSADLARNYVGIPKLHGSCNRAGGWFVESNAEDVISQIKELLKRPDIDKKNVTFFGHSFGAAIGLSILKNKELWNQISANIQKFILSGLSISNGTASFFQEFENSSNEILDLQKLLPDLTNALMQTGIRLNFIQSVKDSVTPPEKIGDLCSAIDAYFIGDHMKYSNLVNCYALFSDHSPHIPKGVKFKDISEYDFGEYIRIISKIVFNEGPKRSYSVDRYKKITKN